MGTKNRCQGAGARLFKAALLVVGAALFFAIISPYNAIIYLSFPGRFIYWLITVSLSWVTVVACHWGALQRGREKLDWKFTLLASLCSTPLVFVTIITGQQLIGYPVGSEFWLGLLASIWVICFVLACAYTWLNSKVDVASQASSKEVEAISNSLNSTLSERLPAELRDSQIYALSADDHYVHVHTQNGTSMQLLKLKDAIAMMGDVAGIQVHRSWWVANTAIKSVRNNGARTSVLLVDDTDVPVSRNGLKRIKEKGLV